MADAQSKETEATQTPEAAKPGVLQSKLGGLLLALVVVGFFAENAALMFVYKPWQHGMPAAGPPLSDAGDDDKQAAETCPTCPVGGMPRSVHPLSPFVVNLADRDHHRFVKATVHIGFEDEEGSTLFAESPALMAPTRQLVLDVLGSRVAAELTTIEGKNEVREELVRRLNEFRLPSRVIEVYITELLVQF